jgi:large subunit ribosomal protein L23
MMKNIFKISLIGLAVVLLGGCIKETFPKGSTVTEEQLTQSDGAISYMLSGIPSAMTKAGTGGFYSTYGWQFDFGLSSIHMSTEVMLEDIAVLSELGYFWYSGFYQNQGMGSDYALCSFFWLQYYEWIKLANDVIGVAGEITEETPEDIKAIVGQAYAYRAMYYLDLARIYEPKPNSTLMPDKSVMDLTVPIITENTMDMAADKKYAFKVAKDSNKTEIRKALEEIFGVDVAKVNIVNVSGKKKRLGRTFGTTSSYKKAVVTLTPDSKEIELFQDM